MTQTTITEFVRKSVTDFQRFVVLLEIRLQDFIAVRHTKTEASWRDMIDASIELHAKLRDVLLAIKKHHDARGHDRCFENDDELYRVVGLPPVDRTMPSVEEHRKRCDDWRAGFFNLPVEQEPVAKLAERERYIKVLEAEIFRIYGVWYGSEQVAKQVFERTLANALPATLSTEDPLIPCEARTCPNRT